MLCNLQELKAFNGPLSESKSNFSRPSSQIFCHIALDFLVVGTQWYLASIHCRKGNTPMESKAGTFKNARNTFQIHMNSIPLEHYRNITLTRLKMITTNLNLHYGDNNVLISLHHLPVAAPFWIAKKVDLRGTLWHQQQQQQAKVVMFPQ